MIINFSVLALGIAMGAIGTMNAGRFLHVTLGEWLQLFASLFAASAAFFSWRVISLAEESRVKPIMNIRSGEYLLGRLKLDVSNLSGKESDKFAKHLSFTISETGKTIVHEGYFEPGAQEWIDLGLMDVNEWKNKTLVLSFETQNGKVYIQQYQFPDHTDFENRVIEIPTLIHLKRIS